MEKSLSVHKRIYIILAFVLFSVLTACSAKNADVDTKTDISSDASTDSIAHTSLELKYATQFSADIYENGIKYIRIADGYNYVLLPAGMDSEGEALRGTGIDIEDAVFIREGTDSVYMAASSAMDLVRELKALDKVRTCSTRASDYAIEEISQAVNSGSISYAGKYSAPDYEMLLNAGTGLAVESTMIYHSPKVKEQLERLGIPVLVERSSYEPHPLGRLEWIKLYGLIFSRYDEAEHFFEEECARVEELIKGLEDKDDEKAVKEVAFFSISPNGYVNVRKPEDYVSTMIDMAGGSYAFSSLLSDEENALSTVKLNWEDFYKDAVDADILIYNSTIYGGYERLDDLISQNALFTDFKAVKEGNVWCTNLNLFQESSKIAVIIEDLYKVINDVDTGNVSFMYRLE